MNHIAFQPDAATRMHRTTQYDFLHHLKSVAFASSGSFAYPYIAANQMDQRRKGMM